MVFSVFLSIICLSGCQSPTDKEGKSPDFFSIEPPKAIEQDYPLLPPYIYIKGYKLVQERVVPSGALICAEFQGRGRLEKALAAFSRTLNANGWKVKTKTMKRDSFWLMARKGKESMELRGVQGRGVVSISILMDDLGLG